MELVKNIFFNTDKIVENSKLKNMTEKIENKKNEP